MFHLYRRVLLLLALAAALASFLASPISITATSAQTAQDTEPLALISALYKAPKDITAPNQRQKYLSRQLTNLLEADDSAAKKNNEPGKLDYDVMNGSQDLVKYGNVKTSLTSSTQDQALVTVQFKNTAFNDPSAPIETVRYEFRKGDRGWRITNILYANHDLLGTLK